MPYAKIAAVTMTTTSRRLSLLFCILVPLAFGALALILGQDGNWDLKNYHWYNPYALLTGRWDFDVAPSAYYNPALDVPVFLAAQALPARVVSFLLGTVQGLNFILLFLLAHRLLMISPEPRRTVVAGALALTGMIGGGHIALIGATFYDNVVSLAIIGAAVVINWSPAAVFHGPARGAYARAGVAGLILGAGVGLKLPTAPFAVGFCLAFLLIAGSLWRRLFLAFVLGVGVLAGMAVFAGPWMAKMWAAFHNPLFPYFNGFFHSPLALEASYRDTRFIPKNVFEAIAYPFLFSADSLRVGEIVFRDYRIAAAYFVWIVTAVLLLLRRRGTPMMEPLAGRYLAAAALITLVVWLPLFSIYRYIIPLEMLAPILMVAAISLWPLSKKARTVIAMGAVVFVVVTAKPGTWGRLDYWTERFVEVTPPPIADPDHTMILLLGYEPLSFVIPSFPPQIPFLRVQGYMMDPKDGDIGINRLLGERIAAHTGDFYVLYVKAEQEKVPVVLAHYGLAADFTQCGAVATPLGKDIELCTATRGMKEPSPSPE